MKPLFVLEKTSDENNGYGYSRIELLCLNYNGQGGAIARFDNEAELNHITAGDLDFMLFGDPGDGDRWYRMVSL